MNIRQLHYFREIVNQGSISKAAEVLHIAQPPLSQQLKKLEDELGTTLIYRYRQKWELTETGEVLYQYVDNLLPSMTAIKQQIAEIEQGSAGTLRIGVSSACLHLLVDYVSRYRDQFPNVKITIEKGNSDELLKKLDRKEIQVAFLLRLDYSEDYFVKILGKKDFVVVSPRSWGDLFSSKKLSFKEIAKHPFIMLGAMEGISYYEKVLEAFNKENCTPAIALESKDLTTVLAMVSKGLGLSIIPRVAYSEPMEQLMIYELNNFDFHVEPIMIRTKEDRVSKATTQFWDLVKASG